MKMTDDELLNQVESLERQAIGYFSSEVAAEQAKAMDYYLQRPFGTEKPGESQVISSDVFNVVEGLTPILLKPFVSAEDVVSFQPQGPEDEEAAEQESDYINFVVTQRNDVFEQLTAWVKTGLLQKNGVVKWWWDDSKRTRIERIADVPTDVLAAILQEAQAEVIEHTERVGQDGQPVHDAVIRFTEDGGRPCYEVLPPEEFLIGRDARTVNPQKARFVQHRRLVTISQLREWGYDVEDDITDDGGSSMRSGILEARDGADFSSRSDEALDPSVREVMFRETFMLVDFDGDGIAELRKICAVGRKVLANEETEEAPFAAWTPYQQPFKFYGRCPADEAIETQLVKSSVLRATMNNLYTINNNRIFAGNGVNLDDLVDNQVAGIVRVESDNVNNVVKAAEVQSIGQVTLPMLEYFDASNENRTGFSRYNQGSADLGNQKTLGEIRIVAEASNGRADIMARGFAETGLRQLMLGIHGLCRRHATKADVVRLRGKWVPVDPRAWKSRYDMTVRVGLGTADAQMKLQGAQMLLAEQKQLAAVPGLVSPSNFYHGASKLAEAVGYRNAEQFFSDPEKQPPPQASDPAQDPAVQAQMADLKLKEADLSLKAQAQEREQARKDAELQLKAQDMAFQHQQAQMGHLKDVAAIHGEDMAREEDARRYEADGARADAAASKEESALQGVMEALADLKGQIGELKRAMNG